MKFCNPCFKSVNQLSGQLGCEDRLVQPGSLLPASLSPSLLHLLTAQAAAGLPGPISSCPQ